MNYISIRQILDDLLADDMMKGLSLERAVNYAVEFIRIVGMPSVFKDNVTMIDIYHHRAELPCDFYEIIQLKDPKGIAYINSADSFNRPMMYSYKIQGNVLITSLPEGKLELAYRSILVDNDGFPLIVDNGTFARALELYIQKRYFTILFNNGKIAFPILQNIQQEYAFYVGQAQSDLIRPNLDQMESIKNMLTALLPRTKKHSEGFKSSGVPEFLKI